MNNTINLPWQDWKTEKLLGRGGFGEVYQVKKEEYGHSSYSAVKIIRIPSNESQIQELKASGISIETYFSDMVKDLLNEIEVMESLKGAPNIVTIDDYKIIEKKTGIGWTIFIRMELLTNLNQYREYHQMTMADIKKLGMDICKALMICQQHHVIHRDIKPANVFISKFGDYKLGDFGIARYLDNTQSGLSQKGTELYMAPEVYKGNTYNSTVDIYSLGLMLYQLANGGRYPFLPDGDIKVNHLAEAMKKRLDGVAFPASKMGGTAFDDIARKACHVNPQKRYQTAKEFYEALELYVPEKAQKQKKGTSEKEQKDPGTRRMFGNDGGKQETPPRREANLDVHKRIGLTLQEFQMGCKKIVEVTSDGIEHRVQVTVPSGLSEGHKLRLKGQGKRDAKTGQVGDLILTLGLEKQDQTERKKYQNQQVQHKKAEKKEPVKQKRKKKSIMSGLFKAGVLGLFVCIVYAGSQWVANGGWKDMVTSDEKREEARESVASALDWYLMENFPVAENFQEVTDWLDSNGYSYSDTPRPIAITFSGKNGIGEATVERLLLYDDVERDVSYTGDERIRYEVDFSSEEERTEFWENLELGFDGEPYLGDYIWEDGNKRYRATKILTTGVQITMSAEDYVDVTLDENLLQNLPLNDKDAAFSWMDNQGYYYYHTMVLQDNYSYDYVIIGQNGESYGLNTDKESKLKLYYIISGNNMEEIEAELDSELQRVLGSATDREYKIGVEEYDQSFYVEIK